jgi:hypothetical protein
MNEEIVFEISTSYKERSIKVSLILKNQEDLDDFGEVFFRESGNEFEFSFSDSNFSFPLSEIQSTSCLIVCGVGLAGPILDCYLKSKGNWKRFKKCLKDQGITLASNLLACITNCVATDQPSN